jgi:hypothetical protein
MPLPGGRFPHIVATLAGADPADKAAVYRELGISLTYNEDGRVLVEARPRVVEVRVGGGVGGGT